MPNYPSLDLRGKLPKDTFQNFVQNSASIVTDGYGDSIDTLNVTASVANALSIVPITSVSASYAMSASYAPVEVSYSSSISNQFGTKQPTLITGNTYSITASVSVSASYSPQTPFPNTIASASWVSASSRITTSDTSSYVLASNVSGKVSTSTTADTASYIIAASLPPHTASWATTAVTSTAISFVPVAATSASWVSASAFITTAQTASYITSSNIRGNVSSASYSVSASYALNGGSGGTILVTGSTYPITASRAISASYAPSGVIFDGGNISNPLVLNYSNAPAIISLTGSKTISGENGQGEIQFKASSGGSNNYGKITFLDSAAGDSEVAHFNVGIGIGGIGELEISASSVTIPSATIPILSNTNLTSSNILTDAITFPGGVFLNENISGSNISSSKITVTAINNSVNSPFVTMEFSGSDPDKHGNINIYGYQFTDKWGTITFNNGDGVGGNVIQSLSDDSFALKTSAGAYANIQVGTLTGNVNGNASTATSAGTSSYMSGSNFRIIGNELQILGNLGTWFMIDVYEDPIGTGSLQLTAR